MKNVTIELIDGRHVELPVLRSSLKHPRVGGFEVDLTPAGWPDARMSLYQNRRLGRILTECTIHNWQESADLAKIARSLLTTLSYMTAA